jgi:hypothetical protein
MYLPDVIHIIEAISLIAFVALLSLAVMRMTIRVIAYKFTGRRPSIVLRRDLALMLSFLLVVGMPIFIGFFQLEDVFFEGAPPLNRLLYIILRNGIAIAALGYWVWAEYFIIGQEGKEQD